MTLTSQNQPREEVSPPLYSSRTIDTFLRLLQDRYPSVDARDVLKYAGITPHQVNDEGHWFTQEQVDRFVERIVTLTRNSNIAREAGCYAASPEVNGATRFFVMSLLGPARVFENMDKVASTYTRSATYSGRALSGNSAEITVIPKPGVTERPYQCQNRLGVFEAVPLFFSYDSPIISHDECIFKSGSCCRYIVTWTTPPSHWLKKLRTSLIFSMIGGGFFATQLYSSTQVVIGGLISTLVVTGITLIQNTREKHDLLSSISTLRESSSQLLDQININYNNALLTNELGQALNKHVDRDKVVQSVIDIIHNRMDFDRGMVLLANGEETSLEFQAGFGYPEELLGMVRTLSFNLSNHASQGVFVRVFREKTPMLVDNIDDVLSHSSLRSQAFARRMGAKAFICCPIVYEKDCLGVLVVDNLHSKKPLLQSDVSLLMGIAPVIGISLHNAANMRAKERQLTSILEVLAATIDARDHLTAGHSVGVTEYSVGICEEMDLPEDFREMVRVAALLHDYGKVGVPDSILKKAGPLTRDEYEIVQTHCIKTREILERVNFEGIFKKVPEAAGFHHERYDGSGYPLGLRGRAIPLGARIIAVADFFEALTSERHYRGPMDPKVVLEMVMEGRGRTFDPDVVDAFIRFYEKSRGPLADTKSGETNESERPIAAPSVALKVVNLPANNLAKYHVVKPKTIETPPFSLGF
ncbi:MAG: HD domain-containing phosphohydrolase [Trichloromonadaceae bacterium]